MKVNNVMDMKGRSVLAALLLVGSVSAMNPGSRDYATDAGRTSQTADLTRTIESMERRHSEEMRTLREQQESQMAQLMQILTETRAALDRSNRMIEELTAQKEMERERLMREYDQKMKEIRDRDNAKIIGLQELINAKNAKEARNSGRTRQLNQLEKEMRDWQGYLDGTKEVREEYSYSAFSNPKLMNGSQVADFRKKKEMAPHKIELIKQQMNNLRAAFEN